MDEAFEVYARWIPPMQEYFARRYPKNETDSDAVHRAAIRAKALDTLRGLLPAATQSNLGHLRHRTGVRGAAAAHARTSADRGSRLRRPDAGRAAESDSRRFSPASISRSAAGAGASISPRRASGTAGDGGRARGRRARANATRSRSPTSIPTAKQRSSPRRSTPPPPCPTISSWRSRAGMTPDDRARVLRSLRRRARAIVVTARAVRSSARRTASTC